ncbi:MAG: agmatinase family protein [Flavobacteriales bacterium]|nr:agmatinase family protein [Flavobacteriales bacterium]
MNTLSFDPDQWAQPNGNLFGLPYTSDEASLVVMPMPWDVTVSYRDGTVNGPEAILNASYQVDLMDPVCGFAWQKGLAMLPVDEKLKAQATALREQALNYLDVLTGGDELSEEDHAQLARINEACMSFHQSVKSQAGSLLDQKKKVAILGGDHSTPLGLMAALGERHDSFGVLQIDAHADLRKAYEGFTYSHASIMYNALEEIPQISKLVQVGIRDFCREEVQYIDANKNRIATFFDHAIKRKVYEGMNIAKQFSEMITHLPDKVYVSFDIDGLDPKLCPQTGTPVPGGFEFEESLLLIQMVLESGREIIGFDINEVSEPNFQKEKTDADSFDAIVGARLLFRISNLVLHYAKS